MGKANEVNLTITVPKNLRKELDIKCRRQDKTRKEVLTNLIYQYLTEEEGNDDK